MLRDFRFPRVWLGAWLLALLATLVICLLPMPKVSLGIDHLDKIEHALGYAVLAAWAAMLFATRRVLVWVAPGLLLWGIAIEGLQALVPWRSASFADVLANTVGVLIGSGVAFTPWVNALQSLVARFARRA
jgi:VanZ family protein